MSVSLTIEVLFTLIITFSIVQSSHLTLTDTRSNRRLTGKTLYTLTANKGATLIPKCLQGCLTTKKRKCKAINVNKKKLICELLSTSALDDEKSRFEESTEWEYYGPKSPPVHFLFLQIPLLYNLKY